MNVKFIIKFADITFARDPLLLELVFPYLHIADIIIIIVN